MLLGSLAGSTFASRSNNIGSELLMAAKSSPATLFLEAAGTNSRSVDDLDISKGLEIWLLQDDCAMYTTKPRTDLVGNIKSARAHWVNRDTLAWLGVLRTTLYDLRIFYPPECSTSGVWRKPA